MKKILITVLILFVIAGIGIGIFVATFDADRYRPLLVETIQESLQKPVGLEKISLGFHGGITLDLHQLVIKQDNQSNKDWLRVKEASAVVDFGSLLKREIKVSSIIIDEPEIHILPAPPVSPAPSVPPAQKYQYRDVNRDVNVDSLFPTRTKKQEPESEPVPEAPVPVGIPEGFSADSVKIKNGKIFLDQKDGSTFLLLQNLDLTAKDIAAGKLIEIEAKAGLLSSRQNAVLQGGLTFSGETVQLAASSLEVDLNQVDAAGVTQYAEGLNEALDLAATKGTFKFQLEPFQMKLGSTPLLNAQMQHSGGRVVFKDGAALDNIEMAGRIRDSQITVQNLSADFAGGKINAALQSDLKAVSPLTTFRLSAERLNLTQLAPPKNSKDPSPEGLLSLVFEGTAQGKDDITIKQTLAGQGELRIENGVIRNLNILREIFSNLNMIPGLVRNLTEHLPEGYSEKLKENDTYFQIKNVPLHMSQGVLSFEPLQITSESFYLTGGGKAGMLDKKVYVPLTLYVEPQLSNAFIHSVNELQYLADREGRLQIPLSMQGILPKVQPVVDYQYISSKLLVSKTQEVLGGLLNKKQDTTTLPADGTQMQTTGTETPQKKKLPKGSDILGQLLQSAMAPKEQQ